MKKLPTILAVVLSFMLLVVPVMGMWIVMALSGSRLSFFVLVIGVLLVVLTGFITFSISNKKFYKKTIIILVVSILVLGTSLGLEYWYKNIHIPNITYEQNNFYSGNFIPFKNSEHISRLDEPSKLKFTGGDDLPVVDGATALFPIYSSFVEATYPADCEVEKVINFSSTREAYKRLIAGEDDIIFVAQPSEAQIEEAKQNGIEFNLYPIGYEAFVFIVNKNNPVSELTLQQIKDIYVGNIKNWRELGGKNWGIKAYQRDENSGSQTAFVSLMGKDAKLISPETQEVFGMDGLVNVVSNYQNHKNAIGYSFRYYVENYDRDSKLKMLKINGVEPTKENIQNKSYPITDNFYAITVKGKESENTIKFIEWILSEQGQNLIDRIGYVSLGEFGK